MTIYLVVQEDRHSDIEITPFFLKESAIKHAKEIAGKEAEYGERKVKTEKIVGRLWCGRYSEEGDCVYVLEREVGE